MTRYFFEEYLERKKYFAKLVNKKPGRINAIKIENSGRQKLMPDDVLSGISQLVNSESVISISPLGGTKEIAIAFKDEIKADDLVGKKIKVGNNHFTLLDINRGIQKFILKATIKFHWLPPGQDWEEIEEYLKVIPSLEIKDKRRENFREDNLKHIQNGVLVVQAEYDLEQHDEVIRKILGIREFNRGKTRIQINGHPPICSICNECGHFERDCKSLQNEKRLKVVSTLHTKEKLLNEKPTQQIHQVIAGIIVNNSETPIVVNEESQQKNREVVKENKENSRSSKNQQDAGNKEEEQNKFSPAKTMKGVAEGIKSFANGFLKPSTLMVTTKSVQQSLQQKRQISEDAEQALYSKKPARDEHGLKQTDEEININEDEQMENNDNIDQLQTTQGAWDSIVTGIEQ